MAAMETRSEWHGSRNAVLTGKTTLNKLVPLASSATGAATSNTVEGRESDERRWAVLMVKSQAGNETDYQQLLLELSDVIYSFLYSRFGNSHFIEDCVQETLIAIHEARHTYDPRRRFRPWFFAIVRHKAIDNLRKRRSQHNITRQYRDTLEVLAQVQPVDEAEMETIKASLLNSLSATHREVLILTKFIGFSVAETAAKLGISESLVKVRVHRAIRKLKLNIEAEVL
jgi:RNA polymerase sigma-70 factor (ECF subfamily)